MKFPHPRSKGIGGSMKSVAKDPRRLAPAPKRKAKAAAAATVATRRARSAKAAPVEASAATEASLEDIAPAGRQTKRDQVVDLLRRPEGASITELMEKMGWQRHTVRGFMAGAMKKAGHRVESFKPEGGERSYRIAFQGMH